MYEQSKSAKRRFNDGAFHSRYFVGKGVDIGGKPDPLSQYVGMFGLMTEVRIWDLEDGDAQKMAGVEDGAFDFVHSSHCLEHMVNVPEALANWIRIVRPGGYLVITVPDEEMYERNQWPSKFNPDHKWSFTVHNNRSAMPRSINLLELIAENSNSVELERLQVVRDFYREQLPRHLDQTLSPSIECAIEIVLRKRSVSEKGAVRRISPQTTYQNLPFIRDAVLPSPAEDVAHGVVIPLATYSPWRHDAAFQEAWLVARTETLVDQYRAYELWHLVEQVAHLPGDLLEVGVWRGGTGVILGRAKRNFSASGTLFLADTFQGVVKAGERDTAYVGGEHADTSLQRVAALMERAEISDAVLLEGVFPDETGARITGNSFKFCHIDVDVYQSALDIFNWVWPRLEVGGVVVFDDYGFVRCEGITRLVGELRRDPTNVFLHNLNGHAVLIKVR